MVEPRGWDERGVRNGEVKKSPLLAEVVDNREPLPVSEESHVDMIIMVMVKYDYGHVWGFCYRTVCVLSHVNIHILLFILIYKWLQKMDE